MENTILDQLEQEHDRDHLHMCGEYVIIDLENRLSAGSPPHVWRIPDAGVGVSGG